MRYIQISEPVFRDLVGCKSKVEDIKVLLTDIEPRITKRKLLEKLTVIAFSKRYQDE